MERESVLLVFAKSPRPGDVKTRLTTLLSDEHAAQLYRAFIRDTFALVSGLDVDVWAYLSDYPWRPENERLLAGCDQARPQLGRDLGDRMANAFEDAFETGYRRAVLIGTDVPTLPRRLVAHAFDVLKEPRRAVIGPSDDGGYYLLGLSGPERRVFESMRYSHARVFEQTVARILASRLVPAELESWYDVDRVSDLIRLVGEIRSGSATCVHTRRVVAELVAYYPELKSL